MARMGSDWVYIGLGVGAIYLVYKATSGISKVTDAIGDTTKTIGESVSNLFKPTDLNLSLGNIPMITAEDYKKAFDLGVKSVKGFIDRTTLDNPNSAKQTRDIVRASSTIALLQTQTQTQLPTSSTIKYVTDGAKAFAPSTEPTGILKTIADSKKSIYIGSTPKTSNKVDTKKAQLFKEQYEKTMAGRK